MQRTKPNIHRKGPLPTPQGLQSRSHVAGVRLINTHRSMDELFDNSQSLRAGDKRAYVFKLLKKQDLTMDDLVQYYKLGHIDLGQLQLTWVECFGARSVFHTKSIQAPYASSTEAFTVKLINAPLRLVLEEPRTISLKVTNMSPNLFRLKLCVNEAETKTIAINALSHHVLFSSTV